MNSRPLERRPPSSSALRVLLLSNVRPARAWKLARRVTGEIPGAEICGIVQRPLHELSRRQQQLAAGVWREADSPSRAWSRAKRRVQCACEELVHRVLWWVHGCPPGFKKAHTFTTETLGQECLSRGWPLLEATSLDQGSAPEFMRQAAPDLILLLGEVPQAPPDLKRLAGRGLVRILENPAGSEPGDVPAAVQIAVEHVANDSESGSSLASLTLPRQPEDGPLGFRLKAELLADDLLVQSAAALSAGDATQAAEQVGQWMRDILSPYLAQLPASCPATPRAAGRAFCRSRLRLFLESVLLVSPTVVARNWLRRGRRRYPVLILAYHLVSDRGHRMGISTERFWRHVRFLQRHYRIVSLSEAVELLRSGEIRVPTVSLTFDDGYGDNFLSLRAVADEAGIPVSIFLTTQPVSLHTEFQHDVVKGVRGAFPLSWNQVRWWSRRGAEFGSHTRTHINCGTDEEAVLREEIRGAKADLERQLGGPVPFFAFPYGQHGSMSETAMRVAQSAHSHFLSSFGGENLPHGSGNNVHLYRKTAYAEPWELELDLQSVFDLLKAARHRLFRADAGAAKPAAESAAASAANSQKEIVVRTPTSGAARETPLQEPSAVSE